MVAVPMHEPIDVNVYIVVISLVKINHLPLIKSSI